MKTKFCFYLQPNYPHPRTAIEAEILFAAHIMHLWFLKRPSGKTPREQNSSGEKIGAVWCSGADRRSFEASAVLHFVFFGVMVNKMQQSAKRKVFLKKNTLPEVFPLTAILAGSGKTMPFEKRRSRYKETVENKAEAYRVYVEHLFSACDAVDARIFSKGEMDEETGLYYYGARYLDPKYSRWLSGDPALSDYIPKAPIDDEAKKHNEKLPGMGGVYNTVNLHLYHYAGNNPVKYTDPDGRITKIEILEAKWKCLIQNLDKYTTLKHELATKIIENHHQIEAKKGEIFDMHLDYMKQEVSDSFAFLNIFGTGGIAMLTNHGSPDMMLCTFIDNINIQALAEYIADEASSGNQRITKSDLRTFTLNKMMEIHNLKAQNVTNKAALKSIEEEIVNIKKMINELRIEE